MLLALGLLSCHRIPLYDPDGSVKMELALQLKMDVSVAADIDLETHPDLKRKVEAVKPSHVRICFYDPETHDLVADDILSADGGFISVPGGTYDVIIYSLGDLETQVEGTETRGSAYAFTSQEGTKVKVTKTGSDNVPAEYEVIYEPDHLMVGRMEGLVIPQSGTLGETLVIESGMESILQTYTFEIPSVQGAENIKSAEIYITGQASGCFLWDNRCSARPCALHLPAVVDCDKGVLYTVFNTFGKFPDMGSEVLLNVQVVGEKGGRYQWTYNITEQFNNPDNTGKAIVINDPMDVPEDPDSGGGGGFDPTVIDWDYNYINVDLS